MVAAMKEGEKDKVGTLRMLVSAIKNEQINDRSKELEDADVVAVIKREVKKRNDSLEQYRAAGRNDLADQEQREIEILNAYRPAGPSEVEITAAVDEAIVGIPDASVKDFGVVMKRVMSVFEAAPDGTVVAKIVRAKLSDKP